MSDALALLAALQLGDSLFPSGGFTLSNGLETLAERKIVRSEAELEAWLETSLRCQVAPSDGVATAAAWETADDLQALEAIDRHLLSLKLAREPREACLRTGRQLLNAAAGSLAVETPSVEAFRCAIRAGRSPGCQPVALGLVGRAAGLARRDAVLLLLHLYLSTSLGAALRLIDVDHLAAQRIRAKLASVVVEVAELSLALPWKEMYACAPQTELMTMLHERSPVRLFAS